MAGDSAERTAELAERAIARMADGKEAIADFNLYTAVRCLLAADRFDTARRVLGSALERAREHGAVVSEAGALAFRCDLHHRTGDLRSAEADGRASLDAGREGWRTGLAATASVLAHVLVEQGELEAAASVIEDGGLTGAADSIGTAYALTMLLHARGGLRLAGDDPRAALEDLLCVGRRQAIMREPNPALINWRSPAALALAKLDRRDEALALAAEEVRLARRFGAPRALGLALRAAGMIAGADGGLELMREAEAVLATSPARLAHAHALTTLGSTLHQIGERRDARAALGHALDIAHTCGATALQTQALRVLRATGARPRRAASTGPDALTASERRAAGLASEGLSNREIADTLFVTVRTVEFHLSSTFRKLGVRSRQELADELTGKID
jgi:DNA-binding CsgD family transcriptional regulator